MNKAFIRQEIGNLMEVINEQQALVLSHEGKIPQIEIDLLMSNLRKAYELIMEINRKEKEAPAIIPVTLTSFENEQLEDWVVQEVVLIPEEIIPEPEMIEATTAIVEMSEVLSKTAVNNIVAGQPDLQIVESATPDVKEKMEVFNEAVLPSTILSKERVKEFSKPVNKFSPAASLFDDAPTIGGTFQGAQTMYDKIGASKEDKSIGGKHQKNPVSDLKKSIGINEKFSFINELFEGDLNSYNNAIEQLNNCNNFQQAMEIISNQLGEKYNWSHEGSTFLQLKNLLARRFSA